MEVARRNNGFRKVAKWIVGAAVVAGAATGNVLCDEVSEPQEAEVAEVMTEAEDSKSADVNVAQADITSKDHGHASGKKVAAAAKDVKLSKEPEAVGFVTSLGKKYTNKEIDDLVDRSGVTGTKGVIQHELGVRRAQLLREMEKFNTILESLSKEIAEEAGKCATYDKLPADLAKKVKWNFFNKRTFGLLEEVPQDLADEMMKCDIYEGFPVELADKINVFLDPFDPSTVMKDEEEDGKRVVRDTPANPKSDEGTPANPKSVEGTLANPKSVEGTLANPKSVEGTLANPKTAEGKKEAEKTKDAMKEKDDGVKKGKEKFRKEKK